MNAIIERVRRIFESDVRAADEQMQADSKRASRILIERAEFHIANAQREVEDHLDKMIAERERQRQLVGPMTFEALPGLPDPAPAEAQAALPPPDLVSDGEPLHEDSETPAMTGEAFDASATVTKKKKAPPRIR